MKETENGQGYDRNMVDKSGSALEERAQHLDELNETQKIRLIAALAESRGLDYTPQNPNNKWLFGHDGG